MAYVCPPTSNAATQIGPCGRARGFARGRAFATQCPASCDRRRGGRSLLGPGLRLWTLQVVDAKSFDAAVTQNEVRVVSIPTARPDRRPQ